MSELRKLREAINDLADVSTAELDDEAWYDRLWELLEPVIDARSELALAGIKESLLPLHDAGEYRDPSTGETQWVASSTSNPLPHVDTSEFDDRDNG